MASRGTQEGPRGLQEPILRAFGLHFGRLDGPRVRPRGSQGVPRESQASPGAIQEKILKEFDVGKVFGCNLCTYGKKWLPFRLGGDIPRQSPPLVWRGRLPGVPVRLSVLFCTLFSIIF